MIMLCYNLYYTYHNKKILGVTFTVIVNNLLIEVQA